MVQNEHPYLRQYHGDSRELDADHLHMGPWLRRLETTRARCPGFITSFTGRHAADVASEGAGRHVEHGEGEIVSKLLLSHQSLLRVNRETNA